jgi:hypothetical protein
MSIRAVEPDDCEGGSHPGDMSSANNCKQLTCKGFPVAETNGIFDAAALLYGQDPRRAHPSLQREDKPPATGTTLLLPMPPEVNATRCCI